MTHTVTVPGVGDVDFPDSMSDSDVVSAIKTNILPQAQKDAALRASQSGINAGMQSGLPGGLGQLLDPRQASQGASLNWGLPAQAAMAALSDKMSGHNAPFEDLYSHYRGVLEKQANQDSAEHPMRADASYALGNASLAPVMAAAAPEAGVGIAAKIAMGTGVGAGVGAAAGAGNAASQGTSVAGGAEGGAGWGAALGFAAPALAALRGPVQGLARQAGINLGGGSYGQLAALSAIQADNTTPQAMLAKQQQMLAAGQPGMAADTAGQNVIGLGRGAAAVPGPARSMIEQQLNQRATPGAQFARLSANAEDLAGTTPKQVDAAYETARDQPLPGMEAEFTRNPAYQDEFETARQELLRSNPEAAPDPLYGQDGNLVRTPTVRDLDLIKKRIQFQQGNMMDSSSSAARSMGAETAPALDATLSRADEIAPAYPVARALGQRQIIANKLIQRLQTIRDSGQRFPDMARGLMPEVGDNGVNLVGDFDPSEIGDLMGNITGERTMTNTRTQTLLGSNTANKTADALNNMLEAGKFIADAKTGGMLGPVSAGLKAVAGAGTRRMNTQLAQGLYSPKTDFLESLTRLYKARMSSQNASTVGAPAYAATSSQDLGNSY